MTQERRIAQVLSTFGPLMSVVQRTRIQLVDPIVIGIVALIIFHWFNVPREKFRDWARWNSG